MRFVVELRLTPGAQVNVTDAFRNWRPNANRGVSFRGARTGTRRDVLFVLGETDDEAYIAEVFEPWGEHGDFQIYSMADAKNTQSELTGKSARQVT